MTTADPSVRPEAAGGPVSTGYLDGRSRARVALPPDTIAPLGYLTPQEDFGDVERGDPLPYTLPPQRRREARILPPPADWGGGLPGGRLPEIPLQFDAAGAPRQWPLRFTVAHWAAELPGVAAGEYAVRCRSIDQNGVAQPLPRPFPKSGRAAIQDVALVVEP